MRLPVDRYICPACNVTLPRAAFRYCPHCLALIPQATSGFDTVCQRCESSIPRAHAGKCPSCAVAQERRWQ